MSTKNKTSVIRPGRPYLRRSAAEWERLLRKQRRSGRTVEAYCAEHGLAESTFWYWRRRVEAGGTEVAEVGAAAKFLAVPVNAPSESCEILAGELRVRLNGVAAQRVLDAIVARIAGAT
jgi:transposase-like protein